MNELLAPPDQISDRFGQILKLTRPAGKDCWSFVAPGKALREGRIWLGGDWLNLEVPLKSAKKDADCLAEMLSFNAELRGRAKFTLRDKPWRAVLAAEIPIDGSLDGAGEMLEHTIAGFQQAADWLRSCNRTKMAADFHERDAEGTSLANLVSETRWSFTERPDGRVAVPLEVPFAFSQAIVERLPGGRVRLSVGLEDVRPSNLMSQNAVNLFLLSACGIVRFARCAGKTDGSGLEWEVVFDTPPDAEQFKHALASLSVGWGLTAREARALQEEVTARRYLAFQEW